MFGYLIHRYAAIFLHDGFNCCSGLWCHYSVCLTRSRRVCYRINAVRKLPSPLVHFCSDRHASPYWTFISRWISMGFTPSLLKNGWQNAVILWCMLQAGPPSLHYYCVVMLHSCIVLLPVGHTSNHEYHFCQLRRQSRCVSNFYRTFKVFIWLSLVVSCGVKWHEPCSLVGSTVHAQWGCESDIKTVAVDLAAEVQCYSVAHNKPCYRTSVFPFSWIIRMSHRLCRASVWKWSWRWRKVCPALHDSFPIV